MARGRPITQERLAKIEEAMAEGWPLREIMSTHKVCYHTLRQRYPDYRGITKTEQGQMGANARRLNSALRKQGLRV